MISDNLIDELKSITNMYKLSNDDINKFINDFSYGLKNKANGLKMLDSFLSPKPTDNDQFVSIDFGGSNIRVNLYDISNNDIKQLKSKSFSLITDKYDYTSNKYTFADIFDLIADKISALIVPNKHYYLGHTFSFAIIQSDINNAHITRWTKNFNIRNAVNIDINALLAKRLSIKGINVSPCVILNDTVATLLTGHFLKPDTDISCIAGTGHNMAFLRDNSIINIENGFFNKLRLTKYDKLFLDSPLSSPEQLGAFVGGKNIGNLAQIMIDDLSTRDFIKPMKNITSEVLSNALKNSFDKSLDETQRLALSEVAKAIFTRSSQIVATEIYAIIKTIDTSLSKPHKIVFDGSIYEKVDYFRENLNKELEVLFGNNTSKIEHYLLKDSSSMGAALAASMYHE